MLDALNASAQPDPMSADPDLLALWTRGWARTRGVTPPIKDGDAWRIEVGAPDQLRRFVFAEASPTVTRRAEEIRDPYVLLKVCADAETVRPLLPPGWALRPAGFMMTLNGDMPTRPVPGEVVTGTDVVDGVIFCRLSLNGVEAARGRVVVVENVAVFDRISVDPTFQRRGLGAAVMRRLQAETGLDRGVLVATEDGRALYAALGWSLHSAYTTAASPGSI